MEVSTVYNIVSRHHENGPLEEKSNGLFWNFLRSPPEIFRASCGGATYRAI